ncbi:hypothetical protein K450DRAFT_229270 [Umbelopsis ramanniana AG]|uniref:RING-type E3 ubiquitin transferase n=1 Tax=Umbelopsis ramanniana AG TaxID=1314678 RepID=A0AAD5HHG1_UMBRA|nr:uncharacterized protein K450DRAFT_229270 [Umbelopsis ramanniana AG]KAI8582153.1 hypothetical protein K450DRAFT_229270 [Umbelopsis ramanniana AG]
MDDSEEICRVCRCEATEDQPLFYPCKCSGSIRYVHQECLTEWLSHSKKKYCELCHHPFTFTPIYREDMPERIPIQLFITQFIRRSFFVILTILRAILVGFVWLVAVPYAALWTWRFYFWSGENILMAPNTNPKPTLNETAILPTGNQTASHLTPFEKNVRTFLSDCMEGQLIMLVVILAFFAMFLLREWIMQNTPADLPVNDVLEVHELPRAEPNRFAANVLNEATSSSSDSESDSDSERDSDQEEETATITQPSSIHDQELNGGEGSTALLPTDEENNQAPNAIDIQWHALDHARAQPRQPAANNVHPPPQFEGNAARQALLAHQLQANQQQRNNEEDFEFENAVDDLDGVLEAIGLRGNIMPLGQHAALMVLLIAGCLGSAVWTPYIVGKAFILMFPTVFVTAPIHTLRLIIDPLVDLVLDGILPLATKAAEPYAYRIRDAFQASPAASNILDGFNHLVSSVKNSNAGYQVWSITGDNSFGKEVAHTLTQNQTMDGTWWQMMVDTDYVQLLSTMRTHWYRFALGDHSSDRMVCILVGYGVLVTIGSWYLARSRNAYGRTVGRALQQAIRQQGAILKVTFFIGIELMLFPLVCGILLDLSTLPLFPESTVISRINYWRANPGIWTFLHWLLGTIFMFHFAVFVTLCRDVVRPGVMWFIRNPNDPQFHPIKEILERPVMFQLRKIGISALLYGGLIVFGIGSVVFSISHFGGSILPLRLSMQHSTFSYPVDLIATHVVIPTTMSRLKVKARFKVLLQNWWKAVSRQLRLSSFMFNGRYAEQEGRHVRKTWKAFLLRRRAPIPDLTHGDLSIDGISADGEVEFVKDGQLIRAPKHDGVPVIRGRRMLVPIDPETYEPIDEVERQMGHPASTALGGEELNTTVVYIPPRFRARIFFFLYLMWLSGAILACCTTIVPLIMGRYLFTFYVAKDHSVHDLYSFLLGLHVLLALAFAADYVVRNIVALQADRWNMSWFRAFEKLKHACMRVANTTYILLAFGLVMPMLVGLFVELYFILPTRKSSRQDIATNLLQDWSVGVVYMNLTYGFLSWLPENYWRRVLRNLFANGILEVEARQATNLFLAPVIIGGLAAIIIPALVAWAVIQVLGEFDILLVYEIMMMMG